MPLRWASQGRPRRQLDLFSVRVGGQTDWEACRAEISCARVQLLLAMSLGLSMPLNARFVRLFAMCVRHTFASLQPGPSVCRWLFQSAQRLPSRWGAKMQHNSNETPTKRVRCPRHTAGNRLCWRVLNVPRRLATGVEQPSQLQLQQQVNCGRHRRAGIDMR